MLVLTIKTDKPQAEIRLFDKGQEIAASVWEADRALSMTIHKKIEETLKNKSKTLSDLDGLICFSGPGSFTGLRIGLSVGNALGYSLHLPVVAENSDEWIVKGLKRLEANENDTIAVPEYGASPYTTPPKK